MRTQSSVWISIADDDLEAAEHFYQGQQYLWAMFMCQQALEKSIKALYFEMTGETPPKKHDLIALAGITGVLEECPKDMRDLFRRLSIYYIETRYPDKRSELEAKCNAASTQNTLARSKEAVEWLRSKLK